VIELQIQLLLFYKSRSNFWFEVR